MKHLKYPRTFHFSFSEGRGSDDKVIESLDNFKNKEIVITEKYDGENTSIYNDYFHARSLDSRHHPSRDWLSRFASEIGYKIPEGYRICGENLFAKHSIGYENLRSYFYGFSVWNDKECLSWDESIKLFNEVGVVPVREIYRCAFDIKEIEKLTKTFDTSKIEGFVVRLAESFHYDDFSKSVVKWVRKNHVQTNKHWSTQVVVPNKLENK